MHTLSYFEASISVPEYLDGFVDVPTFLEACKACPNYGAVWSCPPYDFDVMEYWNRFRTLKLFASKITFDAESTSRSYTKEELDLLLNNVLHTEKQRQSDARFEQEAQFPGSVSLSAGSCSSCPGGCQRSAGKPCVCPERLRYSIESLGGNVGLTVQKLFGIRLEWMEEGKLPHHFVLVSGLLLP